MVMVGHYPRPLADHKQMSNAVISFVYEAGASNGAKNVGAK